MANSRLPDHPPSAGSPNGKLRCNALRSVANFGDNQCLGWRPIQDGKAQPFTWMTYKQVRRRHRIMCVGWCDAPPLELHEDSLHSVVGEDVDSNAVKLHASAA